MGVAKQNTDEFDMRDFIRVAVSLCLCSLCAPMTAPSAAHRFPLFGRRLSNSIWGIEMWCFARRTSPVIGIALRAFAVIATLGGGATLAEAQSTIAPMHRFFNNNAEGHFYTIDEAEKNTVIQNYNWFRYEGIGFYASPAAQSGMLPVYRFFNNNAGGHFYTIDEAEKNTVINDYNWFRYEGIGFYASPVAQPLTFMLPVYRFFNNNAGGHFYTISEAEKNTVIQNYNWFRYEGIGFYAYPPLLLLQPPPQPPPQP